MRILLVVAFVAMLATTVAALMTARASRETAETRAAAGAPAVRRPAPGARGTPDSAAVLSPDPPPEPAAVPIVEPPAAVPPPSPVPPPATALVSVPSATTLAPSSGSPLGAWGSPPAPELDPRPFSEAHWQGLELIPKTATLAQSLGLPPDVRGVIVDDVGLPADLEGFRAGDLVTAIAGVPTPDLLSVIRAADQVREQKQVEVEFVRAGATERLALSALFERLGTANGETPTMIPPGARSPHRYEGPCTKCHRIGTTGSLATDQGDPGPGSPPPIRAGSSPPHRDRGPCTACHQTLN